MIHTQKKLQPREPNTEKKNPLIFREEEFFEQNLWQREKITQFIY